MNIFAIVGTYLMREAEVDLAVSTAISKAGYRHIDTATVYRNEEAIGKTLKKLIDGGICRREDVFITSKLSPADQGYASTKEAVQKSLAKLGTSYIDLYLIHWPGTQKLKPSDAVNKAKRMESWNALEELYQAGLLRAIGVSNYTINHLREMKEYLKVTMPMVLQSEAHPLYVPREEVDFCKEHGIVFEAYASLGEGHLLTEEFLESSKIDSVKYGDIGPSIKALALKYKKTPAQILLRWAVDQGWVILPKSKSAARVMENADLFDFSLEKEEIDSLQGSQKGVTERKFCWDPVAIL
jgi:diketogulonate reductase-like aldo/keto reductase